MTTHLLTKLRPASLAGRLVAPLLLMACCTSCDEPGPRTVPVKGKITFAGGVWPTGGMLNFTPLRPAEGMPNQPGTAEFGVDGAFRVTTYQPNDGLVPGEYSVNIECWETPLTPENPEEAKSYLPDNYQELMKSQLPITIPLDARGAIEVVLDVPLP